MRIREDKIDERRTDYGQEQGYEYIHKYRYGQ
jgi:hypothetical protein